MKRILLLPILTLTVFLVSFKYAGKPKKYSYAEGHCSIFFPAEPSDIKKPISGKISHCLIALGEQNTSYLLQWVDIQTPITETAEIKKFLETAQQNLTDETHSTSKTLFINLGEHPFTEFIIYSTSREAIRKARIYLIGTFAYIIVATGPIEKGLTSDMDNFIGSFRYLP